MADKKQEQSSEEKPSNKKTPQFSTPGGKQRIIFWVIIAALFGFWILSSSDTGIFSGPPSIDYSTFREQVQSGNVEQVVMRGDRIEGDLNQKTALKASENDTTRYSQFTTYIPSVGDDELLNMLESNNVKVTAVPVSDFNWWTILLWGIPLMFLFFIGMQFFRQMRAQGQPFMNIGKSKAKLQDAKKVDTTFDDVAGLKGPKTELKEIIGFLKDPEKFDSLGGEVPKGVLLVGPPGTGKTLLARAVAGEAGVPFFTITGSDFMEMFVGVGAKRVRDMFGKAKEKAPSIIFIDELDSIGRKRGAGLGGGHDEREQTLNQMLAELDGFEPNEGVIVMGATNRPDILDKALLRPGRFDRQITVNLPTQEHREEILGIHAKNKKMSDDIDLSEIARATPGFSGADLRNLLNEAALIAARRKQKQIEQRDIDQARDKVMMGLKREGLRLSDEEKNLLAYHEAGHAVVAAAMPNADPLHKVTVIPRGKAMGVTMQLPEKEKLLYQKKYMLDRMAVMMGGRAAESLIFDTSTSGAENDLKEITKLARKMVLDWGMSDKFGHMAFGGQREQVFLGEQMGSQREYSDSTAREIDEEVRRILEDSYKKAEDALKEHRDVLDKVAEELLEKEEIPGKWVEDLIKAKQNNKKVSDEEE
ncbi:ATP-dependent zinc metalloprotease FtsH [Aliifodinibius sp. S!AR15-10]|uniref:ATP-dependent zinc metalloprotease FtsH n=1 Tax=Aliifodinibius sp. S!AR15-10 TaxID=2950437 RepID=UPI00285AF915|nr:ATP-dependent zinc metalloprotease FtsH [Aliifodinibius sp. S!AR15-10]MDR8391995.1 ATP-dependent zinc metalloprotease FtsH [Aliifodinibius sp. S!AR15-10]